MSNRSSLEQALSQWSYRKEDRMRLVASAQMRRQHTALKREERLGEGMTIPYLSPAERRARMAIAGAPLLFKPEPKPSNPNDPTPERVARSGGTLSRIVTKVGGENDKRTAEVVRNHKVRHIVEQHGDKLEMSHRDALVRFMEDASKALGVRVANLNSSGGGSGQHRLGGLGNAPQRERDKLARDCWVRSQLSPEFILTADALVTRDLLKTDGTPFSMEDFGAKVFPTVQDRNRRWGASAGAIWALAGQLVLLYQNCPVRVRRVDDEERRLEAAE